MISLTRPSKVSSNTTETVHEFKTARWYRPPPSAGNSYCAGGAIAAAYLV